MMVQEQSGRSAPSSPARHAQADAERVSQRDQPGRQIECEPDDAGRSRGTPRSGRGRGVREDEPSGRVRRRRD